MMKAEIIKIGNSKGLRIPKAILKQCKMNDKVNLMVEDGRLIITSYEDPRSGWEKAFQFMTQNKDDQLLDQDLVNHSWDEEEWQW